MAAVAADLSEQLNGMDAPLPEKASAEEVAAIEGDDWDEL